MCRNWELFGLCEFNESVTYIISNKYSVPLRMECGSFKKSSMYLRIIRQSYASNIMKISTVLMV